MIYKVAAKLQLFFHIRKHIRKKSGIAAPFVAFFGSPRGFISARNMPCAVPQTAQGVPAIPWLRAATIRVDCLHAK